LSANFIKINRIKGSFKICLLFIYFQLPGLPLKHPLL
jgi:hypothetical protein